MIQEIHVSIVADGIEYDGNTNNEMPYCYICLNNSSSIDGAPGELISPCACQTTIHRYCLDKWRCTSMVKNAKSHCPTCLQAYQYEQVDLPYERVYTLIVKNGLRITKYWMGTIPLILLAYKHYTSDISDCPDKMQMISDCITTAFLSLYAPIIALTVGVTILLLVYNFVNGVLFCLGFYPDLLHEDPIPNPHGLIPVRNLRLNIITLQHYPSKSE